jgi:hypothetical protein
MDLWLYLALIIHCAKKVVYFWAYLEVIIDAYVEAGLVLENDAKQTLKVN